MPRSNRLLPRLAAPALVWAMLAGSAGAGEDHCRVPMAEWQPREAVQAFAEGLGLTVRRIKIDDGCYEVDARNAQDQRVKLRLDPATLAVLRGEDHDDDDHHDKRHDDD